MDASTTWQDLAEMELVFARSRRRAAARRSDSRRCSPLRWRIVPTVALAIALLGSATEGSRVVENAPAKSRAPKLTRPVAAACGIPTVYAGAFRRAAHETELPVSLLAAVAWEESRMNPRALSEADARGILQLMPGTAKALAIASADPRANILAGARYLGQLVTRFDGNLELALSAYNAGPTAVEKLGRAPSLETVRYAKNVEARAANLASC